MSSPLERLPSELFYQICDTINKSQEYNRQHHATFINLSLVSKKCRSYSTPYIFNRLFFQESCLGASATSLENCISTLAGLDVLKFVEGIDVVVPIASGRCEWECEREKVVRSLENFPHLAKLYIRTGEILTEGLIGEVHQILAESCHLGDLRGRSLSHYWWWYSMKSRDGAQIYGDEKSATMSRCRLVKLLGNSKRRPPLVFAGSGTSHRRIAQNMSNSGRLTYLFLLG